jgi:putative Mg2+ transporter-C (MgtC) family protein
MAASVAMLQMNYLLPLAGKAGDSFITNDLMRLPLGILTGVGFIGGGAILRRGSLVVGVTTAATLWYVQMLLGWTATAVGVFVLWGLRCFENAMSVQQHASLAITLNESGPSEAEIRRALEAAAIAVRDISLQSGSGNRTLTFNVIRSRHQSDTAVPAVVDELSRRSGTAALEWRSLD